VRDPEDRGAVDDDRGDHERGRLQRVERDRDDHERRQGKGKGERDLDAQGDQRPLALPGRHTPRLTQRRAARQRG
jgi:hypothetical protein